MFNKKPEYVMFAALKRWFATAIDANSVLLPLQVWRLLNERFSYTVDPRLILKTDDTTVTLLQAAPELPLYEDVANLNFMHAVVFIDNPDLPANKADPLYAKKIEALEAASLQSLALEFSLKNTQPV